MIFGGDHVVLVISLALLVYLVRSESVDTVDFPRDETMVETETSIMVIDGLKSLLGWWNTTTSKCYFTSTKGEKLPSKDEAGSAVVEEWLSGMIDQAVASDITEVALKQGDNLKEGQPDSPYHALETLCEESKVFWIDDMTSFPHGQKQVSKRYYYRYSSTTCTTVVHYVSSYFRRCYYGRRHRGYYNVHVFRN